MKHVGWLSIVLTRPPVKDSVNPLGGELLDRLLDKHRLDPREMADASR